MSGMYIRGFAIKSLLAVAALSGVHSVSFAQTTNAQTTNAQATDAQTDSDIVVEAPRPVPMPVPIRPHLTRVSAAHTPARP